MKAVRRNIEVDFLVDMIQHNGFIIEKEDKYSPTNVDLLINSSKYTDTEFRCDCGAFTGQDIVGQICPRCHSEIKLHSLNFQYTGWIDIAPHRIISPVYYVMLKRVLGNNMLRFILGDYKSDNSVQYNENDTEFESNRKNKKSGRISPDDIASISKKIPKTKMQYQGMGHDRFYENFEQVIRDCAPKNNEEVETLIREKSAVFTSKIPVYSTAFRPVSKTAETMFYPKINKWFAMISAIQCRLDSMELEIEVIQALNFIQKYLMEASNHVISSEMSKKEGFVRSEIVGGTFCFSGRGVITLDISLNVNEVDIPLSMALTAYQFRITHILATRYNMTLEQAYLFVTTYQREKVVLDILDEIINPGKWIVILREPTNNLASIELCRIRRYKIDDDTISLPVEPLAGFNADFDGDQLNLFFLTDEMVPEFSQFEYSCLTNYVTEKITVDLKEWCSVCLGRMSE